jgi:hypothetical protein
MTVEIWVLIRFDWLKWLILFWVLGEIKALDGRGPCSQIVS